MAKNITAIFTHFIWFFLTWSMAWARPVSYPGGWTIITENNSEHYSGLVHYSPSRFYAIGYRAEYLRDNDIWLHAVQSNILLKRWNAENSQANLYVKLGAGIAQSDNANLTSSTQALGFTGIAADWEDRRYFVSYENRLLHAGALEKAFTQKARVGIAPYIAEFGALHTWLMCEVQHFPEREHTFRVAPLVRLFKGNALLETGIDNQGDILFNFTYRL